MARTVSFYLSVFLIYLSIIILNINGQKTSSGAKTKVVYAINCGGEEHTGLDGVHYEADPLQVGIASDFGRRYSIARVSPQDAVLYQTERYYTNTFIYDIPLSGDGDYVLVLKFSEVYFTSPGQKVFFISFFVS